MSTAKAWALTAAVSLTLWWSTAAAAPQAAVAVMTTTPDAVGQRLAYRVKEKIRRSAGMHLVADEKHSAIQLRLVTVDPSQANEGHSTAYSATWTMKNFTGGIGQVYLTQYVGICGTARLDTCAENLVAITDRQIGELQALIPAVLESSPR